MQLRRIRNNLLLMIAGVAQLCGCSGAQLLDYAVPEKGYTLHKDVAYGTHPRQKLDVYVPEKPEPNGGVIVFFYGGSWQKGDKEIYRFIGQNFASRGYVTVVANYRLYPEIYYPEFMYDGAKAVSWVHAHIGEYGGRPDNIFLSGHSAGAYIAVMLSVNDRFLNAEEASTSWVRGAIGIAGPYDFLPFTDPNIQSIFSQVPDVESQPITFVKKIHPPLLLLSGDVDEDVGVKNTTNMAAKLRAHGSPVEDRVYPGVGHLGIILAAAHGFEYKAPTMDDIMAFLAKHEKHEQLAVSGMRR